MTCENMWKHLLYGDRLGDDLVSLVCSSVEKFYYFFPTLSYIFSESYSRHTSILFPTTTSLQSCLKDLKIFWLWLQNFTSHFIWFYWMLKTSILNICRIQLQRWMWLPKRLNLKIFGSHSNSNSTKLQVTFQHFTTILLNFYSSIDKHKKIWRIRLWNALALQTSNIIQYPTSI